ncbi:MAG: phosphoribosylformylglycinamidine synthase subunit PurS [Proteobacteria bacterium]|nr:phosphoribosylformylglycinamidine synthase subunit PurS [Pseudomonadota bacterium]
MKAKVFVRLKPAVLDVQGKAVERGVQEHGYAAIQNIRIGKLIEFDYTGSDPAKAKAEIEELCKDLLANTIIENYEVQLS